MKIIIKLIVVVVLFVGCDNATKEPNNSSKVFLADAEKLQDSLDKLRELYIMDSMFHAWSKDTLPELIAWLDEDQEFVTKKWLEFNEDSTLSVIYSKHKYNSKYGSPNDTMSSINGLLWAINEQGKLPQVPYDLSFIKEESYLPGPVGRCDWRIHYDDVKLSYSDTIITFFYRRGDLDQVSIEVKK